MGKIGSSRRPLPLYHEIPESSAYGCSRPDSSEYPGGPTELIALARLAGFSVGRRCNGRCCLCRGFGWAGGGCRGGCILPAYAQARQTDGERDREHGHAELHGGKYELHVDSCTALCMGRVPDFLLYLARISQRGDGVRAWVLRVSHALIVKARPHR